MVAMEYKKMSMMHPYLFAMAQRNFYRDNPDVGVARKITDKLDVIARLSHLLTCGNRIARLARRVIGRRFMRLMRENKILRDGGKFINDADFNTLEPFDETPLWRIYTLPSRVIEGKYHAFDMRSFGFLVDTAMTNSGVNIGEPGAIYMARYVNPFDRQEIDVAHVERYISALNVVRMVGLFRDEAVNRMEEFVMMTSLQKLQYTIRMLAKAYSNMPKNVRSVDIDLIGENMADNFVFDQYYDAICGLNERFENSFSLAFRQRRMRIPGGRLMKRKDKENLDILRRNNNMIDGMMKTILGEAYRDPVTNKQLCIESDDPILLNELKSRIKKGQQHAEPDNTGDDVVVRDIQRSYTDIAQKVSIEFPDVKMSDVADTMKRFHLSLIRDNLINTISRMMNNCPHMTTTTTIIDIIFKTLYDASQPSMTPIGDI